MLSAGGVALIRLRARWLLILPVAFGPAAALGQWQTELEGALVYDDNLPRAQNASDIVSDYGAVLRAGIGRTFDAGDHGDFHLSFDGRALRYVNYEGASVASLGGSAGYRRKLGLGLTAPRLAADVTAAVEDSPTAVRDGYRDGALISLGKRFDERLEASLAGAWEQRVQRNAEPVVPGIPGDPFTLQSRSLSARGSYLVANRTALTGSLAGRWGDVVSSTRRNPQIFAQSAAIAPDPAFGADYIAYRLTGASTASFGAGISYDFHRHASIEASVNLDSTRARGGLDYDVHTFALTVVWRP